MKKKAPGAVGAVVSRIPSPDWIEVEAEGAAPESGVAGSLEVRIGSCVVSVFPGFDKPLFSEVCKALLSL